MKKFFLFIRGLFIFIGWSFIFLVASNYLIRLVWNFDFMSSRSWDILETFWNRGGVIKTTSDVLLLMALFLLPFIWLTGFIFALRRNYLNILTAPFKVFRRRKPAEPERIVIKNIKSSQQMIEDIKNEIESLKPKKAEQSGHIRAEIKQKLSEKIKN